MEQYGKLHRLRKVIRKNFCFFLMSLFFTVQLASAAEISVLGTTRGALNDAFTAAGPYDTIKLADGQTIIFGFDDEAVIIVDTDLTLQGGRAGNVAANIGNVSDYMSGTPSGSMTGANFNAWVNSWSGSFNTGSLSGITGGSATRTLEGNTGEDNKWFTSPDGPPYTYTPVTRAGIDATPSASDGLSLKDVHFSNVTVEYKRPSSANGKFVNGLIGNNHNARMNTSMGDIIGNAFTNVHVILKSSVDTDYLAGGGIVGVRATGEGGVVSASAKTGIVSGNIFNGITITTTDSAGTAYQRAGEAGKPSSSYLEGGGLVGVSAASSPVDVVGHARMEELSRNYFTNVHIVSNDVLLGGGLVGLNNNSKVIPGGAPDTRREDTYARLGDASGNIFGNGNTGNIKVEVGYSLRGGGVLGINGLSNASAEITNLQNNAFAGISVETGTSLRGGGIVGLQTNDGGIDRNSNIDNDHHFTGDMDAATARLGNASGNLFLNNQITTGTTMEGGGVIGLRSNRGMAVLDTLDNNVFEGIGVHVAYKTVSGSTNADYALSGGGIVGLSSATGATLTTAKNNAFNALTIDTTGGGSNTDGEMYGGGIIGVHAKDEDGNFSVAMMGNVHQNRFTNLNIRAPGIHGGGIIGVTNETGISAINDLRGNLFDTLNITTVDDLVGGGVLGVWADDISAMKTPAWAGVTNIADNIFTKADINVGGNLIGGGIIGARSNHIAAIDGIVRNRFLDNKIHADGYIDGGGIIGITGAAAIDHDSVALLKVIGESEFKGNIVSANRDILGGIVYSYGLSNTSGAADGLTIRNGVFVNNLFRSETGTVYGTVTVDTGVKVAGVHIADRSDPSTWTIHTTPDLPHTLTLTATSGNSTVFNGNEMNDFSGTRFNSLFFGTIPDPDTGIDNHSAAHAKLIVNPGAGGLAALYDPIKVDQNNGRTFDMTVDGAGHFIWGGKNEFTLTGTTTGTVTLAAGSTTTILDGSSTTTYLDGQTTPLDMLPRYTMSLIAPNFTFNQNTGARLNIEGHNVFDLSGHSGDSPVANLNGHLHFNLNNAGVYRQGEVPHIDYSGAAYQPLLTIITPREAGMVDLARSTVSLSDFRLDDPLLAEGDRFYLIEVINTNNRTRWGIPGDTTPPQSLVGFTEASINDEASGLAYARHGLTIGYDFIIDTNNDNLGNDENTRFLVARFIGAGGAVEFDSLNNGRLTGIAFLQQRQSPDIPIYDYDHGYVRDHDTNCCCPTDPCNLCPRGGRVASVPPGWIWTPVADVQGAWYRTNYDACTHSDIRGMNAQAGASAQRRLNNGRIHIGALVDAGNANYDTYNYLSKLKGGKNPEIRGNGNLDSIGGKIFLRRKWNSGFRLDAMFRCGNIKNSFVSHDLITEGLPARFRLNNTYSGTKLGLTKGWKYGLSDFDAYGRYGWLREDGGRTVLSTNEIVDFKTLNSHRLIGGGRWTRYWNVKLASYLGAGYEHELSGTTRAIELQSGNRYELIGPSLRGGTGVGEAGLIWRGSRNFHVTFGAEGYVGKREGVSGNVAATRRW